VEYLLFVIAARRAEVLLRMNLPSREAQIGARMK
jgi:hypothetical protein